MTQSKWRYKVLYFHQEINKKIIHDPLYSELKLFLYEESIKYNAYISNRPFLNYAIWDILNENKLKISPLTRELIFNTLYIALGDLPAFVPNQNTSLPCNEIANYITQNFDGKYFPTFVSCKQKENNNLPVYLPISANNITNETTRGKNIALYIKEYTYILPILLYEFQNHELTKGSVFSTLHDNLIVDYYSPYSKVMKVDNIKSSIDLYKDDQRFNRFSDYQGDPSKQNFFSNAVFSIKFNR